MSHHGVQGQPESLNVGYAEQGHDASRKHFRFNDIHVREDNRSFAVRTGQL
jgi:hypothetical protein